MGNSISKPAKPIKPEPSVSGQVHHSNPPSKPSIGNLQPSTKPEAPKSSTNERAIPRSVIVPKRHVRLPSSDKHTAGKSQIYMINVDLYEGRVALLSRQGSPLRGYVTTDLNEGAYLLNVDKDKKSWLFQDGVNPLRFTLAIDGPDPFTLGYEQPILLTVQNGLQSPKNIDSVRLAADVLTSLSRAANPPNRADTAKWLYIMKLNDVMLYDVLDQLWHGDNYGQVPVMELLQSFQDTSQLINDPIGLARVLRAIESFSAKPEDLHVNNYSSWLIDPKSGEKDEEREKQNLSTVQIRFTYSKVEPTRSIVIYADNILDIDTHDPDPPEYGPANLLFPKWLTRSTAPRLFEAKKAARNEIDLKNLISIIEQSYDAFNKIQLAWTVYGLAEPLAAGLAMQKSVKNPILVDKWAGSVGAARDPNGPLALKQGMQLAKGGPGVWVRDWEGGSNMLPKSAWYQFKAAGTPPGWGYRCGGIQFENFIDGKLVDAKDWHYWGTVGRSMRGLSSSEIAMEKIEQAKSQLVVARKFKVGVQWRVSSRELVPVIKKGLSSHGLSEIEVIYEPVEKMPLGWVPKTPALIQ